jgi:hypothetical protein
VDRFECGTNWSQKLSQVTTAEFELEQQEKDLLAIVAQCDDPKSDLTKSERREIRQNICGYDFPSASTRMLDKPTMIHNAGTLDVVRGELSRLAEEMPRLISAAQHHAWERENLPTLAEIRAAFDRERRVKELMNR